MNYVEKIHCDFCKKDISKSNYVKHCKTRKHIELSGETIEKKSNLPFIINCECGSVIQRTSLTHHNRSIKHTYFLLANK